MATPFLGEIRLISFNFAPKGWALCNGQFLPINQNQALFSLFGTMYGGNGQTTFALPNLRGRVPVHRGSAHTQGEAGGQSTATITSQTMPQHIHFMTARATNVSPDSNGQNGTGKFLGQPQVLSQGGNVAPVSLYGQPGNFVAMNAATVTNVGGSQPHTNMMPFLTLNFVVALQGIFPSQN